MKKFISLLLVFAVLFGFASCSADKPEKPDAETTTAADETSNSTSSEKKNAVEFLSVYRNNGYAFKQHPETYESLTEVRYQTLYLSEADGKKYARLANSLNSLNQDKTSTYEETADSLYDSASEQLDYYYEDCESFLTYTANQKYVLQRADNVVLSLRSDYDEFSGGMHPNYGTGGYNYDTVTGKELVITDVMTDISTLPAILAEKIKASDKVQGEFFDNLEDTIIEYGTDKIQWTVGYQGVTFYFSPYEIASYAAGLITATVYFDEYPELFNKKYTVAPDSYACELPDWSDVEFDMNPDDGKKDIISLGLSYYDEGAYEEIIITLNGEEYTFDGVELLGAEYYLVNMNGKYFVYVVTQGFNDYSDLIVYDLNGNKIKEVGVMDRTAFEALYYENENGEGCAVDQVFNDPTQFVLETKFDLLSTYSARKTYSVNPETGMPETKDEIYTISDSEFFIITSTADISVKILPELKNETVPAGTDYELIRTDGKTFVDAKLGDGRECRIYVERIDYQLCINGIPEHELFEVLYYAG